MLKKLHSFFPGVSHWYSTFLTVNTDTTKEDIAPFKFKPILPANITKFFRYPGSLTTPGCFESVTWTVFKDPVKISQYQVCYPVRRLNSGLSINAYLRVYVRCLGRRESAALKALASQECGPGSVGHVRYINILTWLRGFQGNLLYSVMFSMHPSLFANRETKETFPPCTKTNSKLQTVEEAVHCKS